MKEPVRQTKHPWIVGIVVAGIAVAYFVLIGSSDYPEPGSNLQYDVSKFAAVDEVESPFEETAGIVPDVEEPRALAIGPLGVYLAGKDVVTVYGEDDVEVARFAIEGTPNCLAVTSEGEVFAGLPREVLAIGADGTVQAKWDDFSVRSYLTSIAVVEDDVYIADAGKRVVYRYDRAGNLQGTIGESDPDRDIPGLEVPSPYLDLAVNDEGHLWVVNPGELGMERYRENGDIVTSWYRPNLRLEGFSGCCNPTQIAFTNGGKLITCEKGLVRIKVYDVTTGDFEDLVAGSKLFPREQSLRDVAVDAQDRILVLDPRSNSIRIFAHKEKTDGATPQPA